MCVHFWKIDPPEGAISQGVCCHCGEIRNFNNTIDGLAPDAAILQDGAFLSDGARQYIFNRWTHNDQMLRVWD